MGFAVGLGLFVGLLPLYGLHLGICIALAWALGLNRLTLYLAANISNPILAPFLVAAGIAVGEWLRFDRWPGISRSAGDSFLSSLSIMSGSIPDLFLSCLLGSAVIGAVLGPLGGVLAWRWLKWRAQGARETSSAS